MKPRSPQRFLAEFAAGCVLLGILVAVLLPTFTRAREAARHASCQNNLKQMGLVFKMFAGENKGKWPSLSPCRDNWMPDMSALYPEYLSDLNVLVCPSSPFRSTGVFGSGRDPASGPKPECVSSLYYVYTGYAICSDEEAIALFYEAGSSWPPGDMQDLELDVPLWENSNRVPSGAQSGTPVLWDRVPLTDQEFSHHPPGVNVLHMDGHVQFVHYSHYNNSNYFPATRVGAETFGSVPPQMPAHCYDVWQ